MPNSPLKMRPSANCDTRSSTFNPLRLNNTEEWLWTQTGPQDRLTDPVYRQKFFAVTDVIAEWVSNHGGLAGRDILDFGCGEATMALGIALRYGARRVVGVEIHGEIDNAVPYGPVNWAGSPPRQPRTTEGQSRLPTNLARDVRCCVYVVGLRARPPRPHRRMPAKTASGSPQRRRHVPADDPLILFRRRLPL